MMKEISQELVEQIACGNGVIFVGAGLSQGAGLPGWSELLVPLADSIGLPPHLRADPLKVAQHYENARGRQALVNHIIEQTDTSGKGQTDNHRRLLRLGVRTWVTTNYDDLIEQTLRQAGERYNKVVRDQDLPYTSAHATTLVKLHGDRDQPDTIVITQQDYNTFFRRFPRIKDKLAGLLLEKTFLFVGYSVSDPDFNQIQAEIAFELQQHQRMAYAVLFDADAFTLSDLRSRNIHLLDIATDGQENHSERLGELLDELIQKVGQARQQRTQIAQPTAIEPRLPEAENVRGLLEAMGYRITDTKTTRNDLYFLCDAKWGAEIRQEVVHFVGTEPTVGDIAALNDAVVSYGAARGSLLTRQPLPSALCNLAHQRERIQCYTLDEFTDRLADFRPYLEHLIKEHEASEIPAFYIPLSAKSEAVEDQQTQVFKPLESFVDAWLTEPGRNHLSILGDFGSGKTWFCQRYAYLAAKRHLADPTHYRIPILVTLRNYSRAYDVEQLITDAIANRYKVGLAAGYKTFARLNEAGRLLLIFDGFDEMERRVSDYRTTVENFWELAEVVCPASKVLLTCRTAYFRHRSEEQQTLTPERRRISLAAGDRVIDLRGRDQFDVVYLLDFDDGDIQVALQKRLPARWDPMYEKIQELSNLRDLASRPVLLEMLVETLPEIQDASQINQTTLYAVYLQALLGRRWREETDYVPPQDRLFFVQELAWEMYTTQRLSIPFSEIPERVTVHFGLKDDPERAAFLERDIRTQSYLVRDELGNYYFAHKSFLEYFVARKLAGAISEPTFDIAEAIDIWKTQLLTPEVQDFLTNMLEEPIPLWKLIEATRDKSVAEVGYAGGNAATMLGLKGTSFSGAKLERTVMIGADLFNTDLSGANLRGVCLRHANLSGCVLADADLIGADLTDIQIEELGAVRSIVWDSRERLLIVAGQSGQIKVLDPESGRVIAGLYGHYGWVWSICYNENEHLLCSVGQDGNIIIWDTENRKEVKRLKGHEGQVRDISFSPNNRLIASGGDDCTIRIWDVETGKEILRLSGHFHPIWALSWNLTGNLIAAGGKGNSVRLWDVERGYNVATLVDHRDFVQSISSSPDGRYWATGSKDGTVKIWSQKTMELLFTKKHSSSVWVVTFSPDGRYIVSGGADYAAKIWPILDEEALPTILSGHKGTVYDATYRADGKRIVTGGNDSTMRIWDVATGECVRVLQNSINCYGMKIAGALGIDTTMKIKTRKDDSTDQIVEPPATLREWLEERGAVSSTEEVDHDMAARKSVRKRRRRQA